jgi:hypothetical protein
MAYLVVVVADIVTDIDVVVTQTAATGESGHESL